MEIFDCYCGVGPWQTRDGITPYKTDEIVTLMDHFGITKALVHSNMIDDKGDASRGNRHVEAACQAHERLMPAFSIIPRVYDGAPGVKEGLEAMQEAGSRALWFFPYGGLSGPWLHEELLTACARGNVPVFLSRDTCSPDEIKRLCDAFPSLRLVLTRVGYGDDYWLYPLLRKYDALHVSLGHFYIPADGPMRFLKHFPADRLIFGSGLPQFSPGGLIAHVMYSDASDEAKQKIMSGNLKRLLGEADL